MRELRERSWIFPSNVIKAMLGVLYGFPYEASLATVGNGWLELAHSDLQHPQRSGVIYSEDIQVSCDAWATCSANGLLSSHGMSK